MSHPWLGDLTTESTIGELPSHDCTLSSTTLGDAVAAEFERRPNLPGVIVREAQEEITAMISRGIFFHRLSRPFSREIFLKRPLTMFLEEALPRALSLPATGRIAEAAVLALDRPVAHAYEPLIVLDKQGGARVIDIYVLLRAQAHLLGVAQAAMLQSEKLASLGQLAAGVAHEVNNPLAFVTNNIAVIGRDTKLLAEAVALYRQSLPLIETANPELHRQLVALDERIDIDYTASNLPELAERSREGLFRIREIVKDLRDFARLDIGDEAEVDLNYAISSTANIISGRAKVAGVTIDLQLTTVPKVPGNAGKINQVVMNLLANAVDACPAQGRVTVRSQPLGQAVSIEVEDTGAGIDAKIANKIFDPFFTTKPPGQGTGLGLTISYGVVRDHGGVIDFVTHPGRGTTFRVLLPISRETPVVAGAHAHPTHGAVNN